MKRAKENYKQKDALIYLKEVLALYLHIFYQQKQKPAKLRLYNCYTTSCRRTFTQRSHCTATLAASENFIRK